MTLAEVTIPEWTMGERFAKARKVRGMNQAQMAAELDVKESTLAAWESDRSKPRDLADIAQRWSEITGVDPAWLLGFRTGSFSPLVGLPATLTPELPFPPAHRQLVALGSG